MSLLGSATVKNDTVLGNNAKSSPKQQVHLRSWDTWDGKSVTHHPCFPVPEAVTQSDRTARDISSEIQGLCISHFWFLDCILLLLLGCLQEILFQESLIQEDK